ncbi:phospholipase A2 [Caerostris extrusa]|uniref:Phospholipase A2 n=1 Tax=Caerostris extrusa TaxID=172846 RepID=A0AAV4NZZ7_CAEEX|nr:phospholipase A2 [Caerostris extrusa]
MEGRKESALTCGINGTVLDLSNMLTITTNRSPLDFLNYGNWCGLGDAAKMHDLCYEHASDTVCLDQKPHLCHIPLEIICWKNSLQ